MKLLKVMETVVMQFSAVVERVAPTHCSCYLTSCLATGQVYCILLYFSLGYHRYVSYCSICLCFFFLIYFYLVLMCCNFVPFALVTFCMADTGIIVFTISITLLDFIVTSLF